MFNERVRDTMAMGCFVSKPHTCSWAHATLGCNFPLQVSPVGSDRSHPLRIVPDATPSFGFLPALLSFSPSLSEGLGPVSRFSDPGLPWLKGHPPAVMHEREPQKRDPARRTWVGGWNVWGPHHRSTGEGKGSPVPWGLFITLWVGHTQCL